MRITLLVVGLVSSSLIGCATFPTRLDEISSQTNVISDRIVLVATAIQPSGLETQYHWIIEKNGKSLGTLFHRQSNFDGCTTILHELPSAIHEEFLVKLNETNYFQMQSSEKLIYSGFEIRLPISRIEVHYRGRKHVVEECMREDVDDGYNKLWIFFGEIQQRSATLSTKTGPPPAFYNRTADQLGGIITGLTPAGPMPTP